MQIEDYFDESYLESFEKTEKLKQEILNAERLLRNPNTHKQFKGFYYDKDKQVKVSTVQTTGIKSTSATQPTSIKTGN